MKKVEPDKYISYTWDDVNGFESKVEITLKPMRKNETFVTIAEGTRDNNEEGLKWFKGNTEGWANFLACLKAWLEYGIKLRKGAFDLSQMRRKI